MYASQKNMYVTYCNGMTPQARSHTTKGKVKGQPKWIFFFFWVNNSMLDGEFKP